MLRTQNHPFASLAVATLLAAGTVGTAIAREELRPRFDKVAAGQEGLKELLPLMADDNGKVSEQAFMEHMQAEFRRLKKDERGQVDALRNTRRQSRPVTFMAVGK
jgi:hypothetical protein